ncbi:C40 family peptidase [Sanguibacter massiliensis]|uniref:C40 family peptidase n=1 Tax=Sanguibacter massiliensis TaxID=1973217 RepID=UPI0024145907|nr:C40 family peptidase [Sanguibacter massiliensis]
MAIGGATAARVGIAVAQSKTGRRLLAGALAALVALVLTPVILLVLLVSILASADTAEAETRTGFIAPTDSEVVAATSAWSKLCPEKLGANLDYLLATIYVETNWDANSERDGRFGLSNTTEEEWAGAMVGLADSDLRRTVTNEAPTAYVWGKAQDRRAATPAMHVAAMMEIICAHAPAKAVTTRSAQAQTAAAMAERGMSPTLVDVERTADARADYIKAIADALDAQTESTGSGDLPDQATYAEGLGADIVAAARKYLGLPYVWGGGNIHGPTQGGFDCSGLTSYAVYEASGGKVALARTAIAQGGQHADVYTGPAEGLDLDLAAPGDLIAFKMKGNDRRGSGDTAYTHIGIYAGGGLMIHAPRPGKTVEVVKVTEYWLNPSYAQNISVRRIVL